MRDEKQIEVGDVVRLKSGGPPMTVESADRHTQAGTPRQVQCTWFERDTAGHYVGGPIRAAFSDKLLEPTNAESRLADLVKDRPPPTRIPGPGEKMS